MLAQKSYESILIWIGYFQLFPVNENNLTFYGFHWFRSSVKLGTCVFQFCNDVEIPSFHYFLFWGIFGAQVSNLCFTLKKVVTLSKLKYGSVTFQMIMVKRMENMSNWIKLYYVSNSVDMINERLNWIFLVLHHNNKPFPKTFFKKLHYTKLNFMLFIY